jgi:AbrB family looped-hinge helix DNA binding protein
MFGSSKIGERGQIVIPKEAREKYDLKAGDTVIILGDDRGLAIIKGDLMNKLIASIMNGLTPLEEDEEK